MRRVLISAVALIASAALALQFYITLLRNAEFGPLVAIGDFLSYFTILSNIIVLLVAGATALGRSGFLSRPGTQAAAGLYIFVVMAIYHLILRSQWQPMGWVYIGTTLLHYVIPILFLGWWLAFAEKSALTWKMPVFWLSFPVAFLIVSLLRGAITGWYPYSFLDVADIGYALALRNGFLIAMLFLIVGYAFVALGRLQLRGGHPA